MPRKVDPATALEDNRLDGFAQQVEAALDHFADAKWLGENSLLAAPFVLGQTLAEGKTAESAMDRGNALKALLLRSAQRIDEELASIISDMYFQRNSSYKNTAFAIKRNMSERTFYRWRQQAVASLANELYVTLLPPLRIEQPIHRKMVGRTAAFQTCLASLSKGHCLYVSGPGGIGKTVFGAEIKAAWEGYSLWYTVRPGISDRLSNFVFAIGYFLREVGAAHTWRQLLADQGVVKLDRVLSILRYDLAQLEQPLLVCLDDVDTLMPERADHAQFLHVLDELRSLAAILLLGQRVVLEMDVHVALTAFDDTDLVAWLETVGAPPLDAVQRQVLLKGTRGQPGLLALLSTLLAYGDDLPSLLEKLPDDLSLEVLLTRVWRRLDEAERQVLAELAVHQTVAPLDIWSQRRIPLDRLIERDLVLVDGRGGVECDPHIRPLVYARTSVEIRRSLHMAAALELEKRGEFVGAMRQYLLSSQPAQCVWLWFSHRSQQIERGQGPAALAMLDEIVAADLPDERDRAALALARAELLRLVGKSDAIAQSLGALPLGRTGSAAAYAQQLLAEAFARQGEIERSLATYRQALETLTGSTPYRQVIIHQKLVHLHLTRSPDLATAEVEAQQALFHAETFAANVEEFKGELQAARARYTRALAIAESIADNSGLLAAGYSHLGMVLLKIGDLDLAIDYIRRGLELSEQRGDTVGPLYDRINLAYALTVQGRFEAAEELAVDGLAVAERMHHAYLIAGLSAAAGDAVFRKGALDLAEAHALRSLLQEEEYFRPWALTVLGLVQGARSQQSGVVQTAAQTLNMAADAARAIDDDYGEAYALHALGEVYARNHRYEMAEEAWKQALHIYTTLGFQLEAQRTAERIGELGLAEEQPAGAPRHTRV